MHPDANKIREEAGRKYALDSDESCCNDTVAKMANHTDRVHTERSACFQAAPGHNKKDRKVFIWDRLLQKKS